MFCGQCGTKSREGTTFCTNCGARLATQETDSRDIEIKRPSPANADKSGLKKRILIISLAALGFILLFSGIVFLLSGDREDRPLTAMELLNLGEQFLLEMNYEQALIQFIQVIEVDPRNPRGYTGAAEAYVGLDRLGDAIAVLEQGLEELPGNTEIENMLERLSPQAADAVYDIPVAQETPNAESEIDDDALPSEEQTPEDMSWVRENWKQLLLEELLELQELYRVRDYDEEFSSRYGIFDLFDVTLIDLNFDGVPEMMVGDGGFGSRFSGSTMLTLNPNGEIVSHWVIGDFRLFRNINDNSYAWIGESYASSGAGRQVGGEVFKYDSNTVLYGEIVLGITYLYSWGEVTTEEGERIYSINTQQVSQEEYHRMREDFLSMYEAVDASDFYFPILRFSTMFNDIDITILDLTVDDFIVFLDSFVSPE